MTLAPTLRAVLLFGAIIPISIAITMTAASLWPVIVALDLLVVAILAFDLVWAPTRSSLQLECDAPGTIYVGESGELKLSVKADDARRGMWRALVQSDGPHAPMPLAELHADDDSTRTTTFALEPRRRGTVHLSDAWVQWSGPFGLFVRTQRFELNTHIAVVPNVNAVKQAAIRLQQHQTFLTGMKIRRFVGDGSEFDSLRQYLPGLDHRTIDWKATARHRKLLCRENRAERNHRVILAFDTGRLMAEPVDGLPKLDHAVNAGLLMAYLSLRFGDQVGAFAFDAEMRHYVAPSPGVATIPRLMKLASKLEYTNVETNFTLGLLELSKRLRRRSVVIVLTDFTDTIGAELMVENMAHLAKRHLVIFVSVRDVDLESVIARRPADLTDVHQAMVANDMLTERDKVVANLRRKGIFCVDAGPDEISVELVNQYLDVHRRELV